MPQVPTSGFFDTLVTYSQWFRGVKFVVIPSRFVWQEYLWIIAPGILLYNWKLVVITHDLIYGVRAAYR